MEAITYAGVLGAIFGSFLNVVVYRLPRHESIVTPASRCPGCGTPVKPYDNIPILSWLLLRGHCRGCGEPISPRYPLVEAGTAALCVGAVIAHDSLSSIALSVALILIVVPAALIDLEHRIIPNRITALGAVLALVLGTALDPSGEPDASDRGRRRRWLPADRGARLSRRHGHGRRQARGRDGPVPRQRRRPGDPDRAALGRARRRRRDRPQGDAEGRKTAIPFGPFLAFGALVAVFVGQDIVAVLREPLSPLKRRRPRADTLRRTIRPLT